MVKRVLIGRVELTQRQRELINLIRNDLEAHPIALLEGVFQCDERSLTRIRLTLESWGATTLTMNGDGQQMWPDVHNQIHYFSEPQFADFFARLKGALAARADRLYVLAASHKALLPREADHAIFDKGSSLWQEVM